MKYDSREIEKRVSRRRKSFLFYAVPAALIFVIGLIFLLFNEKKFIVSGGLFMLLSMLIFYKIVNKYSPLYLFSREVVGINIKEHEYVMLKGSRVVGGGRSVRLAKAAKNSEGARKPMNTPTVHAYVYLKLDSGEIKVIEGITSKHTELYEIGDKLLRFSGTRYPIVLERKVKRQPCPICGAINSREQTRCKKCRLSILSE